MYPVLNMANIKVHYRANAIHITNILKTQLYIINIIYGSIQCDFTHH